MVQELFQVFLHQSSFIKSLGVHKVGGYRVEGQRWKSPGLICVNCQSLEAKGSSTFSGSDGSKLPLVPLNMATGCGELG